MKMKTVLVITVIILIFVIIITFIEHKRRNAIYYPNRKIRWIPISRSVSEHYLRRNNSGRVIECSKNQVGSINLWDFNFNPDYKVMLFCHGTNGNISQRKYMYDICRVIKFNLIVFDYFGYGDSYGVPTDKGIYYSATIAADYCRKHYSSDKVIVWGESLGGTVAAYLMTRYCFNSLILMSSFSCLSDALKYSSFPKIFRKSFNLLFYVCNDLSTKKYLKKIKSPVIIVHSEDDELISFKNAEINFDCSNSKNKTLLPIKGTHRSLIFNEDQLRKIMLFCGIKREDVELDSIDYLIDKIKNVSRDCFIE